MSLADLQNELTVDPLIRGYAEMTNQEIATDLKTKSRSRNRTSMTGSEVLNAIDAGEWAVISDTDKQVVWDVVHVGTINPFGIEQILMVSVFGEGSDTIVALAAARTEAISRVVELGLGKFSTSDIMKARV